MEVIIWVDGWSPGAENFDEQGHLDVCNEQVAVDKAERESQPRAYLLKGHAEFLFNCLFWENWPPQQRLSHKIQKR